MINLVTPPRALTVFEYQSFVSYHELLFPTELIDYEITIDGNEVYGTNFADLVRVAINNKLLTIYGVYEDVFIQDEWKQRDLRENQTLTDYEYTTIPACQSYYASVKYAPDMRQSVEATITINTTTGTIIIGQTIRNDWNRKRNRVIDWVYCDQVDAYNKIVYDLDLPLPAPITNSTATFEVNLVVVDDTTDYEVRPLLIDQGWDQVSPVKVTITVNPGVMIGQSYAVTGSNQNQVQTKLSLAAFVISGSYPLGSQFFLINNGEIIGCGGQGGSYKTPTVASNGERGTQWAGGDAIYTSEILSITNNGLIAGGGGGGSGGDGSGANSVGGGGGAGFPGGVGGYGYGGATSFGIQGSTYTGSPGTHTDSISDGGDLGLAGLYGGHNGTGVVGKPGAYVANNNNVIWLKIGDRRGVAG